LRLRGQLYILGINAYHGDASAALVCDGDLVAAAEEERFNRMKHCAGFPARAIEFCLREASIHPSELQHVGISRDPSAHLYKKILSSLGRFKNIGRDRLANAARILDLREEMARALGVGKSELRAKFHNVEHHKAHMASCFLVSPFEEAAILSIDGFGDFISTMWGEGNGAELSVGGQVEFPHSAGILYTAATQYLGFPYYGDEGKVMGLAPYGEAQYLQQFRDILRTGDRGGFSLNLEYFRHASDGVEMTWDQGSPTVGQVYSEKFVETFGPARVPGEPLEKRHRDIAASLQARLEEVAIHVLNHLYQQTKSPRLCLAGGVAFNSVMNGKILLDTPFREIYIQPAAGDAGTALGACYWIHNVVLGKPRSFVMEHAYTGPRFRREEIEAALRSHELQYATLSEEELTRKAAAVVAEGKIVGWFQGRMEFGPRALGNRSIIADPRRPDMKDILNARVKKREPFRPFAPSILAEKVADYFEQSHPSPEMLMVYQVKPERRAEIPAVTHVDGSGRLQTVSEHANPLFYRLISDFGHLTGVPLVLNTSFNDSEPIVCTPEDAINCFLKTHMDFLFLGHCMVQR